MQAAWNEKPLDNEIETEIVKKYVCEFNPEMKSHSITRLKLDMDGARRVFQYLTWNEKPLDNEIETS